MGWVCREWGEQISTPHQMICVTLIPLQSPVMLDSAGQISLLDRFKRQSQARWVPLLDTVALAKKKGRSESYWPVGVTDKHLMCLILRVSSAFARQLSHDSV